MKELLSLPTGLEGRLWHHAYRGLVRRPHRHAELEVNLVTQGTATYLLGERRYSLRPHTLVWLFPGQDHVLLDESPNHAMWIGVFTPTLLARACVTPDSAPLLSDDPSDGFCRQITDGDARRLGGLFAEIGDAGDGPDFYNAGLGYALLSCWAAYQRAESGPAGADVHPAVERAVRLIRDEVDPLTLDEIARRAGLSPSRLSRLFARQTGVSLVDFRNGQRLERFLRFYGEGRHCTLLEAALDAGFGSYPQFHRVFTERMAQSPSEYRRKLVKGIAARGGEQGGDNA